MARNSLEDANKWKQYLKDLTGHQAVANYLVTDEGWTTINNLKEVAGTSGMKSLVKYMGIIKTYDETTQTWKESRTRITGLMRNRLVLAYQL